MTKLKKYLSALAVGIFAMALTHGAFAEGPAISGFIDTTYNYNLNQPDSQTNQLRSLDGRADSFNLNTAHLTFSGELEEGIGYTIQTDYGTDAAITRSVDPRGGNAADQFDVQEAYLTYKCPHTGAVFKAGKFDTYEGIEVINSPDNNVISRGFLFGMVEPFTHTGVAATYALPAVADISLGAVNGWDQLTDINRAKTFIWRLGLDFGEMLSGGFSGTYGPEINIDTRNRRASFDGTFTVNPMEALSIALQGNYGYDEKRIDIDGDGITDSHAQWFGMTIQPKVSLGEKYFIGGRYEWLQDDDGRAPGGPNNSVRTILQNITLAPGVNVSDSIMCRLEYRYDWQSKGPAPLFEDAAGVFRKRFQHTIGAEMIYSFGG